MRVVSNWFVLAAVALATSCAAAPLTQPQTRSQPVQPGSSIQCDDGPRQALDCSTGFIYESLKVDGALQMLNVGAKASSEKTAVRRIDQQVEQYATAHSRVCADYNACVVTLEDYRRRTEELEKALMPLSQGAANYSSADNYGDRQRALAGIYRSVVPESRRTEEITFRLAAEAELPPNLGGSVIPLQQGARVPTDARVAFTFETSRDAYVYIFQKSPSGEPTVLFPHPKMTGATNPLLAGTRQRIPPGNQRFRINEKDIGIETVYIVVSGDRLSDLDAALARVAGGAVTNVEQDPSLTALSQVSPTSENCEQARGLELETGCTRGLELEGADPTAAVEARTSPGDNIIVQALSFHHVTQAQFKADDSVDKKSKRRKRPAPVPTDSRGMEEEEELINQ